MDKSEAGPASGSSGYACPVCSKVWTFEKDLIDHAEQHNEFTRDLSLEEVSDILSSTIKEDVTNKEITFLAYLLTYTEDDQINLIYSGKSSAGKSYLPLEVASYFPKNSLLILAGASPTSFFHDQGSYDELTKKTTVNLQNKILIFLDQPHYLLLERLRPLLSHDQRVLTYKITDRSKNEKLRTKTIELIGYPTVVFCSAKLSVDDQEKTRCMILSPEFSQKKLDQSLELLAKKLANKAIFAESLESDLKRSFLRLRVLALARSEIHRVIIRDERQVLARFRGERKYLLARHQRDFPRVISLIKALALLNFYNRERDKKSSSIYASNEDIQEGTGLYDLVSQSNELGIQPEALEIYQSIIIPLYRGDLGIGRNDIARKYWEVYHEHIADRKLREELLPALESSGLICLEADPSDRRKSLVYPIDLLGPAKAGVDKRESGIKPLDTMGSQGQRSPDAVVCSDGRLS